MQRLSVVSKRVQSRNSQAVIKVGGSRYVRRLTTQVTSSPSGNAATPSPTPKKRGRRLLLRALLYSSALTLGIYGAGTLLAFQDERFHDFFVEFVPYGERIIEYAAQSGWEGHPVEPQAVLDAGRAAVEKQLAASGLVSNAQKWIEEIKERTRDSSQGVHEKAEKLKATSDALKTKAEKITERDESVLTGANDLKDEGIILSEEIVRLANKAEEALTGNGVSSLQSDSEPPSSDPSELIPVEFPATSQKPTYTQKLPIGFEAPPGFVLPSTTKSTAEATIIVHPPPEGSLAPAPLPLIAPAVSEFSSSEPVLAQLASTIDNLAAFLKNNPSASTNSNAKEILDAAQIDLIQLGERLRQVKEEERTRLEAELEDQAREYSLKLLQLEMDAQDKMDLQEEDWRKFADNERQLILQSYRAKLEQELRTQSEIINERLKEEVIAQGIELQRRWIREIKVRVEAERGGRLAKLDELAADLKRLSRVTLDNSAFLDENLRMHALWSSIRALNAAVQESPVRRPFRDELRILRHVAIAGGAREDTVLAVALETLEDSDIPDVGVEPFADLASWFTTSVAPRVSNVALVPDQDAGLLSYLASSILSSFRFRRRGLVEGGDVLSVLSRAEYYMNEKDLDSAARELNQLKGPAKVLLSDWLEAARKRLEVLQAIEIVQSQATLASLLLI